MNEHDYRLDSDFITDEMQGVERRDLLRLGFLSAIWALAIAMAPRFLFGANTQPSPPKALPRGKTKISPGTVMKLRSGSGSDRPQVVGHKGSTRQNQIHLAAAVKP